MIYRELLKTGLILIFFFFKYQNNLGIRIVRHELYIGLAILPYILIEEYNNTKLK